MDKEMYEMFEEYFEYGVRMPAYNVIIHSFSILNGKIPKMGQYKSLSI